MDRIGHYKIVSELGRGGMGVVLKAHEESLNRFVAIKVLGEHLEQDDEYVQRFVREAQSAAALSHPNIVQIYAISEDQGHHYFVMEYVHGTSVQRMIQTKGKISPVEAARLILQAAAGLQDAHAQDVIHRDIKPANLMVTDRGLVKIADFGLALMGGATSRLTATGMLMGTPGYLSPEQCLDQSPDQRTDIYSLGVTFFEMVTGTMPFRADSPLALLRLIIEVEPPDIREINPEVDDELRGIIAKMLAKNREDRYPNCAGVIADLQDWLEARGESMHRVAGATASGTAAGVMSPPPPPVTQEQINSEPTVVVESGSTKPASPPAPPPAPPAPVPDPVAAALEPRATTVPATQPRPEPTRSRTGLLLAVIAIVVISAGAAAAFLTVKSGILDGLFKRGGASIAERTNEGESATVPQDASTTPSGSEPTEEGSRPDRPGGEGGPAAAELPIVGGASSSAATARDVGAVAPGSGGSPKASNIHRPVETAPQGSDTTPPPPQVVAPPPTATVVIAVGERLLAADAEQYVKDRLRQAGIEVLEFTSISGLEGFHNTESRPDPDQIRDALRPFARYLIPLRVEYLGDRPITYMGQRDIVYQARVNISLVDLQSGRPLGQPENIKIEYTQLNADEVVGRELRKATTGIVQQLPRE